MLGGIFQATTIPALEQVVKFAQVRHTVLAGNIANMDTPGYLKRDLSVEDFQSRLKQAIQSRAQPPQFRSPGEITTQTDISMAQVAAEPKTILYHDESDVGIEYQVTEAVKNQMLHNLALTIMRSQFSLLSAAVSERV